MYFIQAPVLKLPCLKNCIKIAPFYLTKPLPLFQVLLLALYFFYIHTFRPGSYYSGASLQLFRNLYRYFGIFGLAVPIVILLTVAIPILTDILLYLWPLMPILVSTLVHVMWVRAASN